MKHSTKEKKAGFLHILDLASLHILPIYSIQLMLGFIQLKLTAIYSEDNFVSQDYQHIPSGTKTEISGGQRQFIFIRKDEPWQTGVQRAETKPKTQVLNLGSTEVASS